MQAHAGMAPTGRGFAVAARLAWPAVALYAATRVLTFVVLAIWSRGTPESLGKVLGDFDGAHYVLIADKGYDAVAGGKEMALFPLYPMLVRGLGWVSPFSTAQNAILISVVASLVAAWGIFAVGNHLADRRIGILLAGLWGVVPHALVESMAYTESLFTALSAFALLALLRRNWVTAGVLTAVAGLTRPSAIALVGVVGLVALIAVVRRQDGWRPWVGGLLSPLGWLGYILWVGQKTGRVDGWFHIQKTIWRSSFDYGASAYRVAKKTLTTASALDFTVVTFVLVAAILLLALNAVDRLPWPLLLYSALILISSIGAANYYNSKGRLILPAFLLLLPAARALARTQLSKAALIFTFLAATSVTFAGYLAFIWTLSP
jgi:hypothetical protein